MWPAITFENNNLTLGWPPLLYMCLEYVQKPKYWIYMVHNDFSFLNGRLFSDVLPAIKQWVSEDKKIYIYSSGSVEAQKLLFGHTEHGSLLKVSNT